MSEPDSERHLVMNLTDNRTSALTTISRALIASATVKLEVELLVDRERERLRDALERAGEHDRRAELAQAPGEGERGAGPEAALGEREHDAEEDAAGAGAERAGRCRERRIDALERSDRRAEEERARDEGHRQDHRDLREGDVEPERVERPAEQPCTPERNQQADAGNCRRQHERQLDERDEDVTDGPAAARDPVRRGRSEAEDQRHRDGVGLGGHADRVECRPAPQRLPELAQRDAEEHRDDREQQEQQRDARRQEERRSKEPGCD